MANARRWTHRELVALTDGAGRNSLDWLRQHGGNPYGDDWPHAPKKRSRQAVYSQFRRQHGLGGLTRGSLTMDKLVTSTGYSRSQILRAQQALNQQWRRLTPRGPWLISEEQAELVIEWLRDDHWSKAKRLDGCLWCATSRSPMHALGLCRRCYLRYRRLCGRWGLPTDPRDQLEFVMEAGGELAMVERIQRKLVLDVQQLREIALRSNSIDTSSEQRSDP